MILFTLLNPLVDTMRGLYEALHPDEYQRRTRLPKVSLGRLFEPGVGGAKLVAARECERSFLRYGLLEPGVIYVNPLFPFPDRLPSVFSALGEKAIS